MILVESIVWVMRQFQGVQRLAQVLALTAVGALAYFATSDPDLACIRHSLDNASCYEGMQLYITTYLLLCAMVGALFLPIGHQRSWKRLTTQRKHYADER